MYRIVLVLSAIGCIASQTIFMPSSSIEEEEETETVIPSSEDAVLGRSASLPCDIEPIYREDWVYMVFWYKEGHIRPIYSFDVRGRSLSKGKHWSDPVIFGPRAYFVTVSKPATLTLDGIQLDDQGVYRCRVDFRKTPTKNFAVNLTVIVPPHQLLLYDNSGRDVTGTVGPLQEGSDLVLTCEVRGGKPTPTVSWFMNDRLVEGQLEAIGNHVMVNRLEVNGITRDHLNSTYKCQASNTKLMMPAEKTVRLELLLRPQSVTILHKPTILLEKKRVNVSCLVTGSRPKANVSWTRDNREFRRGELIEQVNETSVISFVTFAPVPEDHGTFLKCIGVNPELPGSTLEDSFKLNVEYLPQVALHLGSTLNPQDIKEGDDVYFECNIKTNPKLSKINWYHDGVLVTHNVSSGIIVSTLSLVLQRVTRSQSGSYTCLAGNSRGDTRSSPVQLRVRYAPVCSRDTESTVIGASLDEDIRVRCQVSADPSDVTFLWQFNNSGESFDVSPARFATSSGNVSELKYTPASQRDYGTLTCWGSNVIGRQSEPCVFQVVPAAKPSSLTNCTLRTAANRSAEVVEIECRAGYDGGLPQKFVLEAYDAFNMRLRLNLTIGETETPVFRLDLSDILPSPPALRIFVYALNAKGQSEKLVLDDITLNDAEKRTDGSNMSLVPLAGLLTGSLLTLGLAVLVIVVIAIRRRRHCQGRQHCSHHLGIDASKHEPKSRQGSMLEINTGDNRYVVAYTLKPAADCAPTLPPPTALMTPPESRRQPDILNTPRGADTTPPGLPRPDALFATPIDQQQFNRRPINCNSPPIFSNSQSPAGGEMTNTLGRTRPRPRDTSYSSFATMRRDHIIADSIPGPESCV